MKIMSEMNEKKENIEMLEMQCTYSPALWTLSHNGCVPRNWHLPYDFIYYDALFVRKKNKLPAVFSCKNARTRCLKSLRTGEQVRGDFRNAGIERHGVASDAQETKWRHQPQHTSSAEPIKTDSPGKHKRRDPIACYSGWDLGNKGENKRAATVVSHRAGPFDSSIRPNL